MPDGQRDLAYVCAIAFVDPATARSATFEGRCAGTLAPSRAATGGFGYDPAFVPDDDARRAARWPSCRVAEKDAISHRGRAARELLAWLATR